MECIQKLVEGLRTAVPWLRSATVKLSPHCALGYGGMTVEVGVDHACSVSLRKIEFGGWEREFDPPAPIYSVEEGEIRPLDEFLREELERMVIYRDGQAKALDEALRKLDRTGSEAPPRS